MKTETRTKKSVQNISSGLLHTMRPKQWTKNVVVFAALVFDAKLSNPSYLTQAIAGFVLFCLVSGLVYLINDLVDLDKDQRHPEKRLRPLASGQLSVNIAKIAATILLLICLPSSFLLNSIFGLVLASYLALQIGYSFLLKNIVIVDVLAISAGFVLRVAGGVALVEAERFSPWLYVCTTLLALFLGFSKRRGEIVLLQDDANNHRAILKEYSLPLLDEMMNIVIATTLLAYALYTFDPGNPHLPANNAMMLTIPFVLYGLFRYLYLIHQKGETAPPDEVLLKDHPLQIAIGLWGLTVAALLYIV